MARANNRGRLYTSTKPLSKKRLMKRLRELKKLRQEKRIARKTEWDLELSNENDKTERTHEQIKHEPVNPTTNLVERSSSEKRKTKKPLKRPKNESNHGKKKENGTFRYKTNYAVKEAELNLESSNDNKRKKEQENIEPHELDVKERIISEMEQVPSQKETNNESLKPQQNEDLENRSKKRKKDTEETQRELVHFLNSYSIFCI